MTDTNNTQERQPEGSEAYGAVNQRILHAACAECTENSWWREYEEWPKERRYVRKGQSKTLIVKLDKRDYELENGQIVVNYTWQFKKMFCYHQTNERSYTNAQSQTNQ